MNENIEHLINLDKNEINKCLEGKDIFDMTVWVRDHAQYLKWFGNYNESKLDSVLQPFMKYSFFLYTNFREDVNAIELFRALCVDCVIDLENKCR